MARDHPFNNHSPKIIMGMASQSSSKIRATIAILVLLVVVFQSLLLSWLTIGDMTIKPESKQSTTTSISTVENNNTNNYYNRLPIAAVPPEPLETIQFCAEKCRYLPEMCRTGLHRNHLSLPAPTCLNYSLTVPNDLYWSDLNSANKTLSTKRDLDTVNLIAWIAGQARRRRIAGSKTSIGTISSSTGRSSSVAPSPLLCETVPTKYSKPMMFPEEFEFVVKLMGNARPRTYLEWGCGASTSFYPLLVSGNVIAIDGYPPWCKMIEEEPRVQCMMNDEERLKFFCPTLLAADGVTKLKLLGTGRLSMEYSDADIESAMSIYVNAIELANVSSLDVALVDGRFRLQCALKLLPYMEGNGTVLIHDFWVRAPYHGVLKYYDVIGYARSVVALRKKSGLSKEEERGVYKKYMTREHVSWVDFL